MSLHHPTVAIVGATGAVGGELIGCLESRNLPLEKLRLFASGRSAGRKLLFRGQGIAVEELNEDSFPGVDIALFSAGSTVSRRFAPTWKDVRKFLTSRSAQIAKAASSRASGYLLCAGTARP